MRRVGRQERRHLGSVEDLNQGLGVGFIGTGNNLVGGDGGSLAIGVGHDLGEGTLDDGGGVGTSGRLGSSLTGVEISTGFCVSHTVVGDDGGPSPGGGARNRRVCRHKSGGGSKGQGRRQLHCWGWRVRSWRVWGPYIDQAGAVTETGIVVAFVPTGWIRPGSFWAWLIYPGTPSPSCCFPFSTYCAAQLDRCLGSVIVRSSVRRFFDAFLLPHTAH